MVAALQVLAFKYVFLQEADILEHIPQESCLRVRVILVLFEPVVVFA